MKAASQTVTPSNNIQSEQAIVLLHLSKHEARHCCTLNGIACSTTWFGKITKLQLTEIVVINSLVGFIFSCCPLAHKKNKTAIVDTNYNSQRFLHFGVTVSCTKI